MNCIIKDIDEEDRHTIVEWINNEWNGLTDADLEDILGPLAPNNTYRFLKQYSAKSKNKLIGTIGAYAAHEHPKNVKFVGWFIVHPACRGKGIGSALLKSLEEMLRLDTKYLYVVAQEKAIPFYLANNYKYSKAERLKKFFFHSDCKLMYKRLSYYY